MVDLNTNPDLRNIMDNNFRTLDMFLNITQRQLEKIEAARDLRKPTHDTAQEEALAKPGGPNAGA